MGVDDACSASEVVVEALTAFVYLDARQMQVSRYLVRAGYCVTPCDLGVFVEILNGSAC